MALRALALTTEAEAGGMVIVVAEEEKEDTATAVAEEGIEDSEETAVAEEDSEEEEGLPNAAVSLVARRRLTRDCKATCNRRILILFEVSLLAQGIFLCDRASVRLAGRSPCAQTSFPLGCPRSPCRSMMWTSVLGAIPLLAV